MRLLSNILPRSILALTVVLAITPQASAGSWIKTVAEAQKVAKAKNQLILVDMFADWCGWCHRFEKEVFPSAVFQDASKDLVLLRLDTEDRKEGTAMALRFGVTSLPTFLLLTPDLTVAGTIRGYAPPNDFVKILKQTRAKHEAFVVRVRNESKLGNDYMARLELAKEFATRNAWDDSVKRLQKLTAEPKIPAGIRDEAFYQLALVFAMQQKYADAIRTIRQLNALSQLGEAVERAQLLAGQVYAQQGNFKAAQEELLTFKERFPSSTLMANVDRLLPEIERRLGSNSK
jgi:thioredoxin-related protein